MLSDSVFAVRKGAAWLLAPFADSLKHDAQRQAFDKAEKEFIASQRYNGDQPGDRYVLAMFFVQRGDLKQAEAELRFALKLDPSMSAARSALAEVQRRRQSR